MVTMNVSPQGSREGVPAIECARLLAAEGASIVGVNCDRDPQALLPIAALQRKNTDTYIACQPIGYLTSDTGRAFTDLDCFPLALDSRQLTRFEMARFAEQARRRT